jgi:hypothetical protein
VTGFLLLELLDRTLEFKQRVSNLSFTTEQAIVGLRLCHNVTNMYQSIQLIRIDERTQDLLILVGTEIEIVVSPNGKWRFDR